MPPRFKRPKDLLKIVLRNNHIRSLSQDDNDPLEHASILDEHASILDELNCRMWDLMARRTGRKPMPNLEQLQHNYAELTNDELTSLISSCADFICSTLLMSTTDENGVKLAEGASNVKDIDTARTLATKWKEYTAQRASLGDNSAQELRELLVDGFVDAEIFIGAIGEVEEAEKGPILLGDVHRPETDKDG